MTRLLMISLTAAVSALAMAQSASAETYLREGGQKIEVTDKDGKLFCTRVSDGYEMCNGMTQKADGSWGGKKMKHPDMPRWMSFNGTVIMNANGLNITGCAMGICDGEDWTKQ
jgi:uncharacterized protein (DUF2147 family)